MFNLSLFCRLLAYLSWIKLMGYFSQMGAMQKTIQGLEELNNESLKESER